MKFSRLMGALGVGAFLFSPCHGETSPAATPSWTLDVGAWSAPAADDLVPQTAIYYVPGGAAAEWFGGNAYVLVEPAAWESLSAGDVVMVADGRRGGVLAHRLVRQRNDTWTAEVAGRTVAVTREAVRGRVYGVLPTAQNGQ